jgi:4-hydroxybenzoate polyprenyltransferase
VSFAAGAHPAAQKNVGRTLGSLFALSRTPHAILDLAGPAVAAILWLNRFPAWWVAVLGLVTVFAGYTAVYALNDLIDCREDSRRAARGRRDYGDYLDAKLARHPLALGILSTRAAAAWIAGWGVLAFAGAFAFRPACALIFGIAAALEVAYCKLATVTPFRVLVSGLVKTAGPVAAVFAVEPRPNPARLALLFAWLFLWEIGGQNIPSDWSDVEEDRALGFRTLPVQLSATWAASIAFMALAGGVMLSVELPRLVSLPGMLLYWGCALSAGAFLLLVPAGRLVRTQDRQSAMSLFNRASCYPLAMLGSIALKALLES